MSQIDKVKEWLTRYLGNLEDLDQSLYALNRDQLEFDHHNHVLEELINVSDDREEQLSRCEAVLEQRIKHTRTHVASTKSKQKVLSVDQIVVARVGEDLDWILARVTRVMDTNVEVLDEDDTNQGKTFVLSKENVLCLTKGPCFWKEGTPVFALFPDTTVFYPGIVRRCPKPYTSVWVEFEGDVSSTGEIIQSREIVFRYVLKPPKGEF
eukprot:TRINITY_DN782155_c0_g1_i1.p1 TRINITY_DN782155_c0_g1~~TRINITY_DN782155_c0_g1_i1.p1  ORF type:complete len:209 (-),score=38.72 TRINITY_DN782155_c0_g1_i1:206-832(-)